MPFSLKKILSYCLYSRNKTEEEELDECIYTRNDLEFMKIPELNRIERNEIQQVLY